MRPMKWENRRLKLVNQLLLPEQEQWIEYSDYNDVATAIKTMVVRGAPAIGATAAFGLALAALKYRNSAIDEFQSNFDNAADILAKTRPTAVNLFWAIERMKRVVNENREQCTVPELVEKLVREAENIAEEDIIINKSIGKHGGNLIPDNAQIYTHCNAGALATVDYGTALGVIRNAHEQGKNIHVYAGETRPFLQGSRLTTFELMKDNIPVTLVTDNMAGFLMKQGKVDCVIVGADRVAGNGDVANKIGTYSLSVLAKEHNIPFYVAAPISTIDLNIDHGDDIEIEERGVDEVIKIFDAYIAPKDAVAYHPAFDVTPNSNITAIITEKGIIKNPSLEAMKSFFNKI
ncbi:S-methyl-5-thioribose-1-phosphate isomerase [Desulfuribacillus alkaliarsenatis]|uniref:Methylthioribose-1-phosphate isomerase n=1 Tax=Desulfuribacillus alkaliarsenatis TaxID=766136 RepID=A0A1E5FZH1_9FIRM|nr:S-methyl-5-thioribose-1-phosphate isomerase [Desulfuribacillus alkaliarsenatis]OEF95985.1 S-methyl-5-thioribose-1-phosphate isomerase [Desulfuribacillus alkaliarsenatis]